MKTRYKGLVKTISFKSQINFPLKGLMACTVIARVFAARILRIENDEFFSSLINGDVNNTKQLLNSCIEAGIDLKTRISPGLFGGWIKSDYHADSIEIDKLSQNFAGTHDLITVGDTRSIAISFEALDNGFPSLLDLGNEYFSENSEHKNSDDFCFIATTHGHTIIFFSKLNNDDKKRYFISIDSFSHMSLDGGELKMYDNANSLMTSLLHKWGNGTIPTVDITITRLNPAFVLQKEATNHCLLKTMTNQ